MNERVQFPTSASLVLARLQYVPAGHELLPVLLILRFPRDLLKLEKREVRVPLILHVNGVNFKAVRKRHTGVPWT